MSDPFSVAGSAVGVVSLGITICQGLVSYYQDFKSQDEEIQTATQSLEALAQTLEHLHSVLTRDSLVTLNKPLIDHINRLSNVDSGIKKLEEALNQCLQHEHQKDIVGRLQSATRRLLYPFKKEAIRSLQRTVAELRDNVSTAIQAFQLDVSSAQLQRASELTNITSSISTGVEIIQRATSPIEQQLTALSLESARNTSAIRNLELALITKPQLQRTVCDQLSRTQALLQSLPPPKSNGSQLDSFGGGCDCRRYSKNLLQQCNLGPLKLFRRTSLSTFHHPACSFYCPTNISITAGISLYLSYLMSGTIQLALQLEHGAGGSAISPTLRFRHVVSDSSPAFKLVKDYAISLIDFDDGLLSEQPLSINVQLLELYQNNLASPYDVDHQGFTLLHFWIDSITYCPWEHSDMAVDTILGLVSSLVRMGVPMNETNDSHSTVFEMLPPVLNDVLDEIGTDEEIMLRIPSELTCMGFEAKGDAGPLKQHCWIDELVGEIILLRTNETYVDALECGPLSRVILKRSRHDAAQILLRSPSALNERDLRKRSLLHLAFDWPEGIEFLLQNGGEAFINDPDSNGYTPLSYSRDIGCANAANLLLQAGSRLSSPAWSRGGHLDEEILHFPWRDTGIIELAADAIISRRSGLQDLASKMLPTNIWQNLAPLDDSLLDESAIMVQNALIDHGVHVPPALLVCENAASVYHSSGLTVDAANKLFNAGFRNVDQKSHRGQTPLMFHCEFPSESELIVWFLSSGACLEATLTRNNDPNVSPNITAHHILGSYVGKQLSDDLRLSDSAALNLLAAVLPSSLRDSSRCPCSVDGCLPRTKMFKRLKRVKGHRRAITLLEMVLHNHKQELQMAVLSDYIRYITFTQLGIRHTCWDTSCWYGALQDDEIDEIHDEYRVSIEVLEGLVEKLTAEYQGIGGSILSFLKLYWEPRMTEALEQLRPDQEQYQDQMRDLGVVLQPEEPMPEISPYYDLPLDFRFLSESSENSFDTSSESDDQLNA